jgi:hypothetical protein
MPYARDQVSVRDESSGWSAEADFVTRMVTLRHIDGSAASAKWVGGREDGHMSVSSIALSLRPSVVACLQDRIRSEASRWFVELAHGWHIAPAEDGSGLAIKAMRGIPCEGHDHAVTSHYNTIMYECEAFEAAVEKHKEELPKAIAGFCEMASFVGRTAGWSAANVLAAGFMQSVADFLVTEAQKIDLELERPKAA